MAAQNRTLGKFHLTGLPPAPRGVPQIEVTFDIDANGILNVTAKDNATGKDQKITITSSSGLSKEEVERMAKDAEAHSAEDKAQRESIDSKNQLDSMIYQIEKMLKEQGDKISGSERADVEKAARMFGLNLVVAEATNAAEIVTAFTKFTERGAGALFVGTGAFTNSHREAIVSLAARDAIPAMYSLREFAFEGGLISYGTSITDAYRQAGIYAGRILKGEKPADLPVVQSTKFELVLNLKTARALNLDVPDRLLALADEVID